MPHSSSTVRAGSGGDVSSNASRRSPTWTNWGGAKVSGTAAYFRDQPRAYSLAERASIQARIVVAGVIRHESLLAGRQRRQRGRGGVPRAFLRGPDGRRPAIR